MCSACHGFGDNRADTVPILAGVDAGSSRRFGELRGRPAAAAVEPYAKLVIHFHINDIAELLHSPEYQLDADQGGSEPPLSGDEQRASCIICHGANRKGDHTKLIPDLFAQPPAAQAALSIFFRAGSARAQEILDSRR